MWESGINWFVRNAFHCILALVLTSCNTNFDVLLSVHLSIFILVINQPEAQNFVLQ